MLAVKADYSAGLVTVGTKKGEQPATDKILAALDSIGYSGEVVE